MDCAVLALLFNRQLRGVQQLLGPAHMSWSVDFLAHVMVPFEQDPNAGAGMFDSADIRQ